MLLPNRGRRDSVLRELSSDSGAELKLVSDREPFSTGQVSRVSHCEGGEEEKYVGKAREKGSRGGRGFSGKQELNNRRNGSVRFADGQIVGRHEGIGRKLSVICVDGGAGRKEIAHCEESVGYRVEIAVTFCSALHGRKGSGLVV